MVRALGKRHQSRNLLGENPSRLHPRHIPSVFSVGVSAHIEDAKERRSAELFVACRGPDLGDAGQGHHVGTEEMTPTDTHAAERHGLEVQGPTASPSSSTCASRSGLTYENYIDLPCRSSITGQSKTAFSSDGHEKILCAGSMEEHYELATKVTYPSHIPVEENLEVAITHCCHLEARECGSV